MHGGDTIVTACMSTLTLLTQSWYKGDAQWHSSPRPIPTWAGWSPLLIPQMSWGAAVHIPAAESSVVNNGSHTMSVVLVYAAATSFQALMWPSGCSVHFARYSSHTMHDQFQLQHSASTSM